MKKTTSAIALLAALICCTHSSKAQTGGGGAGTVNTSTTVGPGAKPDLVITTGKLLTKTANSASYSYTVKNVGALATPIGKVVIAALWQDDDVPGSEDIRGQKFITTATITSLAPGQSVSGTLNYSGPFVQTRICSLFVDRINAVAESNEANNSLKIN